MSALVRRGPQPCRDGGHVHGPATPQLLPSGWWCELHIPDPNPRRRRPEPCTYPGARHSLHYARLFPHGWWCAWHTPLALRGLPEYPPGPGIAEDAPPSPLADSRVHDAKAIASGKRRSTPAEYRAAQVAVGHRTELNL